MKYKTMSYYSYGSESFPGVMKKISNTVKAARNIGIDAEHKAFKSNERLASAKVLMKDNSDLIFIRFAFFIHTFLFPILIYKRLTGAKIVVDVATPRFIGIKEMYGSKSKNLIIKILWNYIFSSWILFPANKIIQYADESAFFSFGLKHKTLKMGNGILIDKSIKLVKRQKRQNEINLIGVASLAFWHGYDRLIKALELFAKENPNYKITFKIIGGGEVLQGLKDLVIQLKLEDNIIFTGPLYGEELEQAYLGMDIGVSSFGLFRKGLDEASDLKTREYMAKGLCVLGAGKDPDFTEDSKFRFTVPNDESIEPIVKTLVQLVNKELSSPEETREYAKKHLAFEGKLKIIFEEL
jgi:glycosyltransferase involved in cell wall biosynthesis